MIRYIVNFESKFYMTSFSAKRFAGKAMTKITLLMYD